MPGPPKVPSLYNSNYLIPYEYDFLKELQNCRVDFALSNDVKITEFSVLCIDVDFSLGGLPLDIPRKTTLNRLPPSTTKFFRGPTLVSIIKYLLSKASETLITLGLSHVRHKGVVGLK